MGSRPLVPAPSERWLECSQREASRLHVRLLFSAPRRKPGRFSSAEPAAQTLLRSYPHDVKHAKKAPPEAGDTWTWLAMDADHKLVISWAIGLWDLNTAYELMVDPAERLV